jgi:TfoX/Sxy family transcriptional regulator of competence genes
MAYDEKLAARLRAAFGGREGVEEKKMFGGLAFLVGGSMACGVVGEDLMVRVGADGHDDALKRPHTRPMDFTGKPMRGFVYVAPDGAATREQLDSWVRAGVTGAESAPPRKKKPAR